jgi:HEAT repeat protein
MAALVTCLMRGTAGVKCRAARALKNMGWSPRSQEEEIQFCVSAGEWQRVTLLGKAAVPAIAAILKHGANEERVSAANALGALNEPMVLQSLVDALGDSESLVRTAALNGIAEIGEARAAASIIGVLRDHDRNVRSAAAMALGQLGDLQAVDHLLPMLTDTHWEVRAAALQSLGRLGDRRALEPIANMLQDKDAEIRQQAADALGRLGDPAIVPKLVLTMMDPEMGVRNAASRALTMIEPYWERAEVVHKLIPQIEANVRHKEVSIQYSATMLLRRIAVPVAPKSSPAPQRLEVSRPTGTPVGVILQNLLVDPDPDVRLAAVESLGRMKSPEAAAALRPALNDSNNWVRLAANSAVAELAA